MSKVLFMLCILVVGSVIVTLIDRFIGINWNGISDATHMTHDVVVMLWGAALVHASNLWR